MREMYRVNFVFNRKRKLMIIRMSERKPCSVFCRVVKEYEGKLQITKKYGINIPLKIGDYEEHIVNNPTNNVGWINNWKHDEA